MHLCTTKVVWGSNIVSVSTTNSQKSFEGTQTRPLQRCFFAPIFSFPQEGKIRFYLCCKKHEFCFWIFFKAATNISFHTMVIYIVLSTSTNHFIFSLEILFCLILQTPSKSYPKWLLKKSSLLKCAFWSNFRSFNFFSSKKFATNQHEEKKKKPKPTKVFATFLEGSTIVFLFLFKRRNVFYDGMKSEAKEMTNGRNIEKNLTVVKKKTTSLFRAFTFVCDAFVCNSI